MIHLVASLLAAQASAASASPPPAPPPPCASEAHAAFDFWVGDWDVYPQGSETIVAHSKIERLYAGCAIRENWMPLRGPGGGSLSNLDPSNGHWHQTWIGASPGRVEFDGGLVNGAMVLTGFWQNVGGPGKDGLVRMTYTAEDGGAVRQHGLVSYDYGVSWEESFDFLYRPHKSAE